MIRSIQPAVSAGRQQRPLNATEALQRAEEEQRLLLIKQHCDAYKRLLAKAQRPSPDDLYCTKHWMQHLADVLIEKFPSAERDVSRLVDLIVTNCELIEELESMR